MGVELLSLIDRIRAAKGPFFVARLSLRVTFNLNRADLPDSDERRQELLLACRSLGYDFLGEDSKRAQ
jgi:hypothetical protein